MAADDDAADESTWTRNRHTGRFPADFGSWPREEQLNYLTIRTRAALVCDLLARAGVEFDPAEIDRNYRLTKDELAAIQLVVEGYDR